MTQQQRRLLERNLEAMEPKKQPDTTWWLGYTLQGVFSINIENEPAMLRTRSSEGNYVKAYNDAGIYVEDDLENAYIAVEMEERYPGEFHIVGLSTNEKNAYFQINPNILIKPHMHNPQDIGDDEATPGNILTSDGINFQSVDPDTVLVTHASLSGVGVIVKTGASSYVVAKIGNDSVDPAVTDDSSEGFVEGYSWWLNTASEDIFDLVDDSVGAAVWIARGSGGGGSGIVESIVAGSGITVDDTDPANPIISATGGGSGVYPLTFYPPDFADFTALNISAGSKLIDNSQTIYVEAEPTDASSDNVRGAYKTAPSVPYTISACIESLCFSKNYHGFGLFFRESSSGKLYVFGSQFSVYAQLLYSKFTSPTIHSAVHASISHPFQQPVRWMRIEDDNTDRICSVSTDGINWIAIFSVERTDFLTADQVGFWVEAINEDAVLMPAAITVLSWLES